MQSLQSFVISGALFGRDAIMFAWAFWANKLGAAKLHCKQGSFFDEIFQIDIKIQWHGTPTTYGKIHRT